jgi:hypothetical protein
MRHEATNLGHVAPALSHVYETQNETTLVNEG